METNTLDSNLIEEKKIITDALVASGGKRFVNYVIDSVVLRVFYYVFEMASQELAYSLNYAQIITIYILSFLLITPGYYILMEHFTGKTIGKYVTKTNVVNMDGEKPGLGTAALRTLCRLIPFEAFSFLGTPCVGWHDKLAKTRVIDDN